MESHSRHSSAHDSVEPVRPLDKADGLALRETGVKDTLLGLIVLQNTDGGPMWMAARPPQALGIMLGRLGDLEVRKSPARRPAGIGEQTGS